jgi:transposase
MDPRDSEEIDWQEEALRWRHEAYAIRSLVEELRVEVATLREENANLREENARLREENAKLREENTRLEAKVSGLERQNEQLLRKVLGPTSEKMPSIERELRSRNKSQKKSGKKRRRENAAARAKLDTEENEHCVPEQQKTCPNCPGVTLRPMPPERSVEYEYVPAKVVRIVHLREKLSCPRSCGFIVTADGPSKAYEKARYGPGLIAHIVTAKCADVLPLYRQAKQLARLGIPIGRSTLTDLFHRAAGLVTPLVKRMEQRIAQSSHVLADETSFPIQETGACRRGFIWTFIGSGLILYRYSGDRSGETPLRVLGGTAGKLLVDGYTGYNHVCDVAGRDRAGCLAHFRRYFFEALGTAPEPAQHVLDAIIDIYKIEREAAKAGVVGTDEHLQLRQREIKPIMDELKKWLHEQQPLHRPKSPIARAIGYGINQWDALTKFLDDPALPPDNNESERRLRLIALGRKNYLFAADDAGAENLATLMSLVVTCEAHGIDPEAYLADVLIRMQTHPQSHIDELLPPRWKMLRHAEARADTDQYAGPGSLAA